MDLLHPAFIVRKDKVEEFLNEKRDTEAMLRKFEQLKRCELDMGKSESHPDIAFLNQKIEEFKKEMGNK